MIFFNWARHGTARHGTARHGTARHGTARHGTARHGTARHGTARHGTARHGTARHGTARHGTARHGTARHGTARHGTARHGTARHGTALASSDYYTTSHIHTTTQSMPSFPNQHHMSHIMKICQTPFQQYKTAPPPPSCVHGEDRHCRCIQASSHHIKLSKTTAILYKCPQLIDPQSMRILYCSVFLPYINYCSEIWENTYPTNINGIVLLQKRAIRLLFDADRLEHTAPVFRRANVLKFTDLVKF